MFIKHQPRQTTGKTSLVLSGGGFPGWMYEIGCITALDDFFEEGFSVNDFDIFVGTSAGACVAAMMANEIKPRSIFEDISEDRKSLFNFKSSDIYGFGYQETFPLIKRFVRSLPPLIQSFWRNRKRTSWIDVFYALEEFLPSGVLTLKNFDAYLAHFFNQPGYSNDFRNLKKELYIPAVDIDMSRYDVFGEGELADVPISKAVTASSAMPIVFQPIRIKDRDYMDGGVGRVAYMDIAINHGATLLLIINPIVPVINDKKRVCLPTLYGACGSLKEKGFTFVYDQANRISTATRIYLAMRRYQAEHPDKDLLLIQPDPSDNLMFSYNVINMAARLEILNYGYHSTINTLRAQFSTYEKCFERHGIKVTLERFK